MRLSVMLEPQEGLTYAAILAVAQHAEQVGFDAFYRSDHYSSTGPEEAVGSTDAWATLAGVARETRRIALGTLVSPVTFRPAGNLAKIVATVAEMAGTADGRARLHVGVGTGWMESEHRMHGFPFEDLATRFRRLEEHLRVLTGLFDPGADPLSFDGEFERLHEARFAPKPQPRPRLIVGGRGRRKTPRLAARYADEMNSPFVSVEEARDLRGALDEACEREGRNPSAVAFTVMTAGVVGADDADLRHRAERLHERSGASESLDAWLDGRRATCVIGTPEQAADRLGALAEAGVDGVALQHLLPEDFDMLDIVMREVAPRLGVTAPSADPSPTGRA